MSLLFFDVPADEDVVDHITNLIKEDAGILSSITDPEEREETEARIEKWKEFVAIVKEPSEGVAVLPLSIEGTGSSANLMILQAFQLPGDEKRLQDETALSELKDELYPDDTEAKDSAYFVVKSREGLYEWWESGAGDGMDALKGLVKTSKYKPEM